jgi:hypothetical protein
MTVKSIVMLVLMMGACPAMADSLIQLPIPGGVVGQEGRTSCVGSGFNADHSVFGACNSAISSACSGRGCNPVTNTTTYVAAWDADGVPISAIACSVTRHHSPQPNVTTYENGFDGTSCLDLNFFGTHTVLVVDGTPFYYVATDPVTGAELVNSNVAGLLVLP